MTDKELEQIYNQAYKAVYWTAMSLLKDKDDAEDVVQDTFISFINSYSDMKDTSKVVPLLKKIAANKCLNRLKLSKTDTKDEEFFENVEAVPEDFLPDSIVESEESRRIIMDIIENALSDDIRRTLILFYFDEMSTKEIAKALDVPEGTVRRRLNFARNKIKKEVEKYEEENKTKLLGMAALPFLSKLFIKEAEAVPFKAMPASLLTTLSASAKASTHGAATKLAASAAKKGTGIIMKKAIIGGVIAVVSVGSIAGVTLGVMKLKDDRKPRRERISRDEDDEEEEETILDETEGEEGVVTSEELESYKNNPPEEWLNGEWQDLYSCDEFAISATTLYVTRSVASYYYTNPVVIWKLENKSDDTITIDSDGFMTDTGETLGLDKTVHYVIDPHDTIYSTHIVLPEKDSVSDDGIHFLNQIEYLYAEFDVGSYDPDKRMTIEKYLDEEVLTVDFSSTDPQG
ncbi:MAG: sigma-70 family RNA polymerase sigma factor [Clostridia bacterium]|nr:sigma-70 family RNA polymerase sigma factor [Clostridia bacterium]